MKLPVILSKTTSDKIKSKVLSTQLFELVLDVYASPKVFAQIVNDFDEEQFEIVIVDKRERLN